MAADVSTPRERTWDPKRVSQLVALILSVAAGIFILITPLYQTETSDSSGKSALGSATLIEQIGMWAIPLALIPIAFSAATLVAPTRIRQTVTVLATALMAAWVVLGIWTIGIYYVPALACLVVSIFAKPRGH